MTPAVIPDGAYDRLVDALVREAEREHDEPVDEKAAAP
jgi:hypothetical protein